MIRTKDDDGNDIIMGRWYWARSRTGKIVGAGKFSATINTGDMTFWMNGVGYEPASFRFYPALSTPVEQESASGGKKIEYDGSVPDWRIGLSVKPKMRYHELYYERAIVEEVFPDGTGGVFDPNGVLRIKLTGGKVMLVRSEDWVAA